jgi:hypothetical protein
MKKKRKKKNSNVPVKLALAVPHAEPLPADKGIDLGRGLLRQRRNARDAREEFRAAVAAPQVLALQMETDPRREPRRGAGAGLAFQHAARAGSGWG